jgi:hypothetical protein
MRSLRTRWTNLYPRPKVRDACLKYFSLVTSCFPLDGILVGNENKAADSLSRSAKPFDNQAQLRLAMLEDFWRLLAERGSHGTACSSKFGGTRTARAGCISRVGGGPRWPLANFFATVASRSAPYKRVEETTFRLSDCPRCHPRAHGERNERFPCVIPTGIGYPHMNHTAPTISPRLAKTTSRVEREVSILETSGGTRWGKRPLALGRRARCPRWPHPWTTVSRVVTAWLLPAWVRGRRRRATGPPLYRLGWQSTELQRSQVLVPDKGSCEASSLPLFDPPLPSVKTILRTC